MKTNIKINDIDELSKYIATKSEEIDSTFDNISETISLVSDAWNGKDSKEFVEEAKKNINNVKEKNNKLKTFSDNLSVVSKDYSEVQNSWIEQLKRERFGNE